MGTRPAAEALQPPRSGSSAAPRWASVGTTMSSAAWRSGAAAAALPPPLAVARPLLLGVDGVRCGLARGVTGRIGAAAGGGGGGALCGGEAGAEAAVRRGVAWRSSASISECGV